MTAPERAQVTLSALEHYAYCPRQAGLILLEESFADDAATVRGTLLHEHVHDPGAESRPGIRTLRALPVWHDGLGLVGVCDVVEVLKDGTILPIEHKSGRYKPGGPADLQVAAQAICLEERFDTVINEAAIFSSADRRRHPVPLTPQLRDFVAETTEHVREILTGLLLPEAAADARCRRCSMNALCMPTVLTGRDLYQRLTRELLPYDA